jgi:hypothetical protein
VKTAMFEYCREGMIGINPMKDLLIILLSILVIGCAGGADLFQPDAGQVSEGNTFSFRDTVIKINPDFKLLQIKEKHKIPGGEIDTGFPDINQIENLYLFFGVDDYNKVTRAAMINLFSFANNQIRWNHRVDIFKEVKAIQKGKEKIDDKDYWYTINKLLVVSEKIFFALEDEGYQVRSFACWLTKSYGKVVGNDAGVVLFIS